MENLEKNEKAVEELHANLEKIDQQIEKLKNERTAINHSMQVASFANDHKKKYSALRAFGAVDSQILYWQNQRELEQKKLNTINKEKRTRSIGTGNEFFIADMPDGKTVTRQQVTHIRERLMLQYGCSESAANWICNDFAYAVKFGSMVLINACYKLYQRGVWQITRGFARFLENQQQISN